MKPVAADLDTLHAGSDDPWGFRTRWYERRKRALLLAALPRETFRSAWEMGCSNGELAAHLAPRCAHLLASDGNRRATELATARLAESPHADAARLWLPADWPDGTFDLVVISKFASFLEREEFRDLLPRLARSLTVDGVFAACHWRHPVECGDLTGDEIHSTLDHELPWTLAATHVEPDWISRQLAHDTDVVCGLIEIDDWLDHPESIRTLFDAEYVSADGHRHVHGANLGVRASVYREVGGFQPLRVHEDATLVAHLESGGAKIAWVAAPRVITSARRQNRASRRFRRPPEYPRGRSAGSLEPRTAELRRDDRTLRGGVLPQNGRGSSSSCPTSSPATSEGPE